MTIRLYHCKNARSLRPLWTLEELGLGYELVTLPFPPRVFAKDYLGIHALGTVPYLIDGNVRMTESAGICQYLVERYGPTPLAVERDDPEYPSWLNWLHHSDATLTFPLALVLRYSGRVPGMSALPQAASDYTAFFLGRLRLAERALADREYLCAGRFTIADVCVGYALHLACDSLDLADRLPPNLLGYLERLRTRPGFRRAAADRPEQPA
jgi:glutathione S-transferase